MTSAREPQRNGDDVVAARVRELACPAPTSIESLVEQAVARALDAWLAPHVARLRRPEPLVCTVAQTAELLQVSPDTVARLITRGALVKVPHVDGKTLIPRRAVDELVASAGVPGNELARRCS